jgi:fructose/tagatose bisphosphate aldolase
MRELLDHAAVHGYGIPAFNVNNLEQVQAVMAAADETGAPVILQSTQSAGDAPRSRAKPVGVRGRDQAGL